MAAYFVNRNQGNGGDHEVHKSGCAWMPQNAQYLGDYATCQQAVAEARRLGFSKANGCAHCSPACHTGS
jgi:hypothetical protein